MSLVEEVIGNHEQDFDFFLRLYEGIMSKLWPPTSLDAVKERTTLTEMDIPSRALLLQGMILHTVRLWENLITNDMILLFAKDTTAFCDNFGYHLEKNINPDEAEAIFIGKAYLDFKGFDNIISLAKSHLAPELNPFKRDVIPKDYRDSVDELMIVRNHIAHRSKMSRRSYRKLLDNPKYERGEMELNQFLLAIPGKSGKGVIFSTVGEKRVFELYIEALKDVSKCIVKYLERLI